MLYHRRQRQEWTRYFIPSNCMLSMSNSQDSGATIERYRKSS